MEEMDFGEEMEEAMTRLSDITVATLPFFTRLNFLSFSLISFMH